MTSSNIAKDTIVTIKMNTGEEILATLVEALPNENEHVSINIPLTMMNTPQGLGMAPYLITVEPGNPINLPKTSICLIMETSENSKEQYQSVLDGFTA